MYKTPGRSKELLRLGHLTSEEMMKLYGEPTQGFQTLNKSLTNPKKALTKSFKGVANTYKAMKAFKKKQKKRHGCQKLIISHDNATKTVWDFLILFIVVYSCVTNSYFFCFHYESSGKIVDYFGLFLESLFALDILLTFFVEYRDEESMEIVKDFSRIICSYVSSWLVIDVLAVLPFAMVMDTTYRIGNFQRDFSYLIKLVRLFKLPKFFGLLDSSKFDNFLDALLEKENTDSKKEKSRQEKMTIKYVARYIFKVFRLILIAIMLAYFLGCTWYLFVDVFKNDDPNSNFNSVYKLYDIAEIDRLVICVYFVLTTLSTVGYGEMHPESNTEKIFGISLMILGIAFFSYIMGNFNDVIVNYDKKMGIVDRRSDLQVWMTSLTKFDLNKPIPQDMIKRINDHFEFFWKHDRLSSLTPDDKYLKTMPAPLRIQLMDFLFDDIHNFFRGFFNKKKFRNSKFYYEISFLFKPRKYEKGELIIEQDQFFEEINLLLQGEVMLEIPHDELLLSRFYQKGYFFGDFSVLFDMPTNYCYSANSVVKVISLPKYEFKKILTKYPAIKKELEDNASGIKNLNDKRFVKMIRNQYKEKYSKEIEIEEAQRIFRSLTGKRKNATFKEILENEQELSIEELNRIKSKLDITERTMNSFEESMDGFSDIINKEMTGITKKLETLKNRLLEQEN